MIKTKYRCSIFVSVVIISSLTSIMSVFDSKDVSGEIVQYESSGLTAGVTKELYEISSKYDDKANIVAVNVDKNIRSSEQSNDFIELNKEMYTTSVVNLRESESIDSNIIEVAKLSKKVRVIGYYEGSEWYKVDYNGKVGYMNSNYLSDESPFIKLNSTAYYDEYNRPSASGRPLIENHSLAGKNEWLGRQVELYECTADGSVGNYLGIYTFDDTGFGVESGFGESNVLSGKTIGTIENGTCIDIYMNTYSECMNYGRNEVFIRFID